MTLTDDQRHDVRELVCEILELDTTEVPDDSRFVEDHGSDSLLAIEVLSALEKKYRVKIEQSDLARMDTMNGVFAVLNEALTKVAP